MCIWVKIEIIFGEGDQNLAILFVSVIGFVSLTHLLLYHFLAYDSFWAALFSHNVWISIHALIYKFDLCSYTVIVNRTDVKEYDWTKGFLLFVTIDDQPYVCK